ncbi:MAG: hypothetical protein R6X23_07015 [Acidimicrobiia bacterium]
MRRLLTLGVVVTAIAVLAVPATAAPDTISIAAVTPGAGPAGTEVGYTLAGTDANGTAECQQSSAYRLELLAPDGTVTATGGVTVVVPEGAAVGDAAIRLVCYVPDGTGRRVIRGVCARFVVSEPGEPVPAAGEAAIECPPTPRITLSQAVLTVERLLSQAFNPQLSAPLVG